MNSIPLISNVPGVNFSMNRGNTSPEIQMRQEINTSLVALKKEAGTLEGLINEASQILDEVNNRIATLENDTVKKNDVVNVVQSGNMNPVTSNAVATSNAMPVNSVTSGNMHSVTSGAVANALSGILVKTYHYFVNGTGTIKYFRITGFMRKNAENVFILQARAGELLIISCGHGDGDNLATPKIKRLLNTYSKIIGFTYLSNGNVIVAVNTFSHECVLTQLAGAWSDIANIVITETTQSEYNSGTAITIET